MKCDKHNNGNSWFLLFSSAGPLQKNNQNSTLSGLYQENIEIIIAIAVIRIVIIWEYTCYNDHNVNACAAKSPHRSIWQGRLEYSLCIDLPFEAKRSGMCSPGFVFHHISLMYFFTFKTNFGSDKRTRITPTPCFVRGEIRAIGGTIVY